LITQKPSIDVGPHGPVELEKKVYFVVLLNTLHEPISPQAQQDEERDKIDLIRLALARNLSRTIL